MNTQELTDGEKVALAEIKEAIIKGDMDKVKKLAFANLSLVRRDEPLLDENGHTLTHFAANNGDLVTALFFNGFNIGMYPKAPNPLINLEAKFNAPSASDVVKHKIISDIMGGLRHVRVNKKITSMAAATKTTNRVF